MSAAQSGFDGVHHLDGAGLALGREGAVDIGLAERFAEIAVRGADAAPPPWLLFFGTGQSARKEVEILIHQGLVHVRRCAVNHLPAHIGLPVIERVRRG